MKYCIAGNFLRTSNVKINSECYNDMPSRHYSYNYIEYYYWLQYAINNSVYLGMCTGNQSSWHTCIALPH